MPPSQQAARHREDRRRARKAAALVPLAIVSGSWATFLLGSTTAISDAASLRPGRVSPPAAPIEAPASLVAVRRPPVGSAESTGAIASQGIPSVALAAYQRAAVVVDAADESCHLGWPLLAAIGSVESDHGRHAGSVLSSDGRARPSIFGPLLDGTHRTSRIPDTDGGLFDRNKQVDRAVGPMQFIPSTWLVVGVDADGDGQRDPQDINDAALAAAVYLCSGDADLSTAKGADSAIYRYNHSAAYVDLVSRIARGYAVDGYASKAYGAYAPVFPDLDYHPAPTKVRHHHSVEGPDVTPSASPTSTPPPETHAASTGHQAAPPPASHGPRSGPEGQHADPVTTLVDTAQTTVTALLSQSQDLLQVLVPTP